MATKLDRNSNTVSADGDFYWEVRPAVPASVKIDFTTAGTDGAITVKDSQGSAYRNSDNSADISIDHDGALDNYVITPTGGHINFTAAAVTSGSSVARIYVTQPHPQ